MKFLPQLGKLFHTKINVNGFKCLPVIDMIDKAIHGSSKARVSMPQNHH